MRKNLSIQLLVVCCLLTVMSIASAGSPFCALRDPSHQLYEMFPDATAFRSVVQLVDDDVRDKASQSLPFTIHSRELGEHTLYVPVKGSTPLGFLHVRTEASPWGLVEIAWALNSALQVRDFRFQRCRGAACDEVSSAEFRARLRGRGVDELRKLLDSEGKLRTSGLLGASEGTALHAAVVRSAIKTIFVTQSTWDREVAAVQRSLEVGDTG